MPEKKLSGLEKVAVLLRSLPKEVLQKAMSRLEPRQAWSLQAELAKTAQRPDLAQVLTTVLDEATEVLSQRVAAPPTTSEEPSAAGKIDIQIAGTPEPAPKDRAGGPATPTPDSQETAADPLTALVSMPPEVLAKALDAENARTVCVLMNRMDVEPAAQVYKRLTPGQRKEVSLRFTEQTELDEDLLRQIAHAVLMKCAKLREAKVAARADQGSKDKRIAALLRGLEREDRMEMIAVLEGADAELTTRIKNLLYVFEDILRMENTSVQKLLSDTDTKSLALAMAGATEEIQEKLFSNLSKRAQTSLKEEIELNGNVPAAKSKEARDIIAQAIQRLDERGEMALIEK